MQIRYSPHPNDYQKLNTEELRSAFLVESLFTPGKLELVYTDADRAIIGSAVPGEQVIKLTADAQLRSAFFCERRELGVLNVGGAGTIVADGKAYEMGNQDCLYLGRGTQNINFFSAETSNPAAYFLLSYPAHVTHPTALAK